MSAPVLASSVDTASTIRDVCGSCTAGQDRLASLAAGINSAIALCFKSTLADHPSKRHHNDLLPIPSYRSSYERSQILEILRILFFDLHMKVFGLNNIPTWKSD